MSQKVPKTKDVKTEIGKRSSLQISTSPKNEKEQVDGKSPKKSGKNKAETVPLIGEGGNKTPVNVVSGVDSKSAKKQSKSTGVVPLPGAHGIKITNSSNQSQHTSNGVADHKYNNNFTEVQGNMKHLQNVPAILNASEVAKQPKPDSNRKRDSTVKVKKKAKDLTGFSGLTISNEYVIGDSFASGSFGQIHYAERIKTGEKYIIKFESMEHNLIPMETKIYKVLEGTDGFPSVVCSGVMGSHNFMIMTKLNSNLGSLLTSQNEKFSLRTVLLIAIQILIRIEGLHRIGFLHRDIKPENFVLGPPGDLIYLIDFGLAKRYWDESGKHVGMTESRSNLGVLGTARFASLNAHLGRDQSRRDDLEAIGYMLIQFLVGKLPWQDLFFPPQTDIGHKLVKIFAVKDNTVGNGTLFKNIPDEFKQYFDYIHTLEYESDPDYSKLRSLFRNLYKKEKFPTTADGLPVVEFDWKDNNVDYVEPDALSMAPIPVAINVKRKVMNAYESAFHLTADAAKKIALEKMGPEIGRVKKSDGQCCIIA